MRTKRSVERAKKLLPGLFPPDQGSFLTLYGPYKLVAPLLPVLGGRESANFPLISTAPIKSLNNSLLRQKKGPFSLHPDRPDPLGKSRDNDLKYFRPCDALTAAERGPN